MRCIRRRQARYVGLPIDLVFSDNQTVFDRCVDRVREGVLDNHYEDKKCKRKRDWMLTCNSFGLMNTVPRKGRWIKEPVIKGEVILRG